MKSISIEGSTVSGVITQSGLLDIIDNGQIPSFSVSYIILHVRRITGHLAMITVTLHDFVY